MKNDHPDAKTAISYAKAAYQRGDKLEARKWASSTIQQDPSIEEAWLILAAVSNPHASIAYLKFVLQNSPDSMKAKGGLRWAIARLKEEEDHY